MADAPKSTNAEPSVAAELVRRIGAGDEAAEHELVARYSRGLLYLLRSKTGDEELALDLRQDTFRIALEKLRADPINEPERLAAFLRGTAVNLLSADRRKTARRRTAVDSDVVAQAADDRSGPFETLSREDIAEVVQTLLAKLEHRRYRDILIGLYIRDQDRETICRDLEIDPGHFSRVLYRAKQSFRELLLREQRRKNLRLVE